MSEVRVAFLRGINVGGRRISGPQLVSIADQAGFAGAISYQTSGNLVLTAVDVPREDIENRIADAFAETRGWDVDVFVRTLSELRDVVAGLPFSERRCAGLGKPQVGFVHRAVDVSKLQVHRDLVASVGTEVYWVPHTGVSDADLAMADFLRIADTITIRTLGTLERLITKFTD